MAATKRKLLIEKGATFSFKFTWKTGPTRDTVVPVDLTGCSARMQVREGVGTPILLELTTENGGITLGGVAGTIELRVSAEASSAFTWERGLYQLEISMANGDVRRLMTGAVTVSPEITE